MKLPLTGAENILIKSNSDKFDLCWRNRTFHYLGMLFIDEGVEICTTEHFVLYDSLSVCRIQECSLEKHMQSAVSD